MCDKNLLKHTTKNISKNVHLVVHKERLTSENESDSGAFTVIGDDTSPISISFAK